MKEWVGEAATFDKALERALLELGLTAKQVDVKVLNDRSSGLMSMMGFRRVRVRVAEKVRRVERREWDDADRPPPAFERRTQRREKRESREETAPKPREKPAFSERPKKPVSKPAPSQPGPSRKPTPPVAPPVPLEEGLGQWRTLLGWDDLTWHVAESEGRAIVTLKTTNGQRLAGNGGRALEAFEYLFNLATSSGRKDVPWVSVRVDGQPTAEDSRVVDKALHAAFQVRRTGKPFRLDPMSASQRRAVHQALSRNPDVVTSSEGEGPRRHVVVSPKNAGAE